MKTTNHTTTDILDNLTCFNAQTQAVVKGLLANDHFQNISPTLLADTLWLVSNRLDDIEREIENLIAADEPTQPIRETGSNLNKPFPSYDDYQSLEGASCFDYPALDEDIELLPFVSANQDQTHLNHWDIARPTDIEQQVDYGCRLAAHFVQFIATTNDGTGSGSPLLRDMVADMCQQYGQPTTSQERRFAGDDWAVMASFFDFIEKAIAVYIPADTDVLAMAEQYIQEMEDDLKAEDSEQAAPQLPYMIRKVTTNTPNWWHGEAPVTEYEAARWSVGGNIERQQFKTEAEAESWAQEGVNYG